MSIASIQSWLLSQGAATVQDETNFVREAAQSLLMQAIADAGVQEKLVFVGGTALRMFHGLDRFSEDLDFILRKAGDEVLLDGILASVKKISEPYGFRFKVRERDKRIQSCTLVDKTVLSSIRTPHRDEIDRDSKLKECRVKLEINTDPPHGIGVEAKAATGFVPYTARCADLPTLFGGKLHAILSRGKQKGRDWYDLLWYHGKKVAPQWEFLQSYCSQDGISLEPGVGACHFSPPCPPFDLRFT